MITAKFTDRKSITIPGLSQYDYGQTISKYNFPLYLWELIAKSLYLEIKGMYEKQITKDKADYNAELLKECECQEEGTNKK